MNLRSRGIKKGANQITIRFYQFNDISIISSRCRQLNGYAAYQRMQSRITSIGKRIPFTASMYAHHFLMSTVYTKVSMTSPNATEPLQES